MRLTRSQLHERISDLSGQYRAAQENKRLTSAKRVEQDHLSDLARQADEKADAQIEDVRRRVDAAKADYASAVDELLDGPIADQAENAFDRFGSYPNGDDSGVNRAFTDAITP